jgi:hypothetical protein
MMSRTANKADELDAGLCLCFVQASLARHLSSSVVQAFEHRPNSSNAID